MHPLLTYRFQRAFLGHNIHVLSFHCSLSSSHGRLQPILRLSIYGYLQVWCSFHWSRVLFLGLEPCFNKFPCIISVDERHFNIRCACEPFCVFKVVIPLEGHFSSLQIGFTYALHKRFHVLLPIASVSATAYENYVLDFPAKIHSDELLCHLNLLLRLIYFSNKKIVEARTSSHFQPPSASVN